MQRFPRCAICGSRVTAAFWVCDGCCRAYGLDGSWSRWPQWAKAMRNDERRERRRAVNWREYHMVSLDSLEMAERTAYGGPNDDPIGDTFLAG